jgi:hypothetical protein
LGKQKIGIKIKAKTKAAKRKEKTWRSSKEVEPIKTETVGAVVRDPGEREDAVDDAIEASVEINRFQDLEDEDSEEEETEMKQLEQSDKMDQVRHAVEEGKELTE